MTQNIEEKTISLDCKYQDRTLSIKCDGHDAEIYRNHRNTVIFKFNGRSLLTYSKDDTDWCEIFERIGRNVVNLKPDTGGDYFELTTDVSLDLPKFIKNVVDADGQSKSIQLKYKLLPALGLLDEVDLKD